MLRDCCISWESSLVHYYVALFLRKSGPILRKQFNKTSQYLDDLINNDNDYFFNKRLINFIQMNFS